MEFFSTAWSWISGSSISAALTRTALVGYVARLLYGNTASNVGNFPTQPDKGVRLQLTPSTDNQIPVLYGDAYFGGNITDAKISADYKKMTYCLTIAEKTGTKLSDGQATSYIFKDCYFNNNRVIFKADGVTVDYTVDSSGNQDVSFRDLVKVYFYANGPLQPQGFSGTTPQSYTVMPGWNATDYPMTGLIYAIIEITYSKDKNVTSLPDITWHITSSMNKPGDVLYDYMTNSVYGANINSGLLDSSFADLNTYSTTGFTYTNKNNVVTTSSITINGLVDTTQKLFDNITEIAKATNAWVTFDTHQGKWRAVINQPGSSIASFTDSNIIGEIAISGTSLTQLNNKVNVKYQNTDIYDKTDFVKIEIPAGQLYPNEGVSILELGLNFTNKQIVASRIGLQALKQARLDKIISFKADYSYFDLNAGDLIDVTSSVYGFTNKVFRIITITEVDGDDSTIQFEIKALEYSADVYSYNITEYNVTTQDGILTIGSIGKPNIPTVTKTEQANVPKIVISAQVPSGIVDAVEYWITFDTTILNDSARTYIKVGEYSNTNGTVLTQNDTVSYTYTGLQQSDFYIKVRGINNVTTGPFSDPTGLIAYVPIVVADTVSDTPVSVGGTLMGLGLLTLLNNLDKLFKGDSTVGSLFDKIFSVFNDKTGVDLVGQASGGTLVVASEIAIKDEGTSITTNTSSINFVGSSVTATNVGNDVTVTISASGATKMDDLTDADTTTIVPAVGDYLYWDGTNWKPDSSKTGPGGANAYTSSPTDVCEIDGYIAVGTVNAPVKTNTDLTTCGGSQKFTVKPKYNGGGYISTATFSSKTGPTGGYYYVNVTFPSTTAPTGNWTVTSYSVPKLNGYHAITSSTTTSATIRYTYDPGTIPAGTTMSLDKASGLGESPRLFGLKKLIIKNNIASSYTLTITPNVGSVAWSPTGLQPTEYAPTSSSGLNAGPSNNYVEYGDSTIPLTFTGDYNAINTILQGKLDWSYNNWGDYSTTVSIPPANTSVTISYALTANGVTKTHTETLTYVSYATMYPLDKSFTLS